MKLMKFETLKRIEKNNPAAAKKAKLQSFIVATTVVGVLVSLSPAMKENALFISLAFGMMTLFSFYTSSMNEVDLEEKLESAKKAK